MSGLQWEERLEGEGGEREKEKRRCPSFLSVIRERNSTLSIHTTYLYV